MCSNTRLGGGRRPVANRASLPVASSASSFVAHRARLSPSTRAHSSSAANEITARIRRFSGPRRSSSSRRVGLARVVAGDVGARVRVRVILSFSVWRVRRVGVTTSSLARARTIVVTRNGGRNGVDQGPKTLIRRDVVETRHRFARLRSHRTRSRAFVRPRRGMHIDSPRAMNRDRSIRQSPPAPTNSRAAHDRASSSSSSSASSASSFVRSSIRRRRRRRR